MKNKILTIILLLLLVIPLVFSLLAGVSQALGWAVSVKQGTWTMKALDLATPGASEIYSIVMNPEGKVLSEGLGILQQKFPGLSDTISKAMDPQGALTQEALKKIAQQNPEEFAGLMQVLTVKDQLQAIGFDEGKINYFPLRKLE